MIVEAETIVGEASKNETSVSEKIVERTKVKLINTLDSNYSAFNMSITNNARRYFDLENTRANLAKLGKFSELKRTYKDAIVLENKNTGMFWDEKFSSSYEKHLMNYMEIDRNKFAVKWFQDIVRSDAYTLNIGCGDGNFERGIAKIGKQFTHKGIDIAKKSLSHLAKEFRRFSFEVRDILNSPPKNELNYYDVISLFEVLEHISPKDTFTALGHIYDLLKPGGFFLLSVPMNEGLEEMFPKNPNEHLRCYSIELIDAELTLAGFNVLRYELFFAFPNFYALKKLLAKTILRKKWKPNNILLLCRKN